VKLFERGGARGVRGLKSLVRKTAVHAFNGGGKGERALVAGKGGEGQSMGWGGRNTITETKPGIRIIWERKQGYHH